MKLPQANYYVLCNDKFMSGWGRAQGLINTLIFPCDTLEQAYAVEKNARDRGDQTYVRIAYSRPRLNHKTHYYSVHDHTDYSRWYTPNAFHK